VIVAVSTVKDTLANVQRFVRGNLANGVDHLVVHLDGAVEPEVTAFLDAEPHVTVIDADGSWWAGKRPPRLNTRQKINANLALAIVGRLGFASWLIHLDGDEIAVIDRDVLDAVGPDVTSVGLETLEAVAELRPAHDPTLFKRRLDDGELFLVHTLGVIDRPQNSAYFKGHLQGRPGVRPGAPLWLGVHVAKDLSKEPVTGYTHPGLRVLHFESPSGEEFARKWQALTSSGPGATHNGTRATLADAVRSLLALDLETDVERELLLQLFARARADDVETLSRLGVLEEIDIAQGKHEPEPVPADAHRRLLAAYAKVRDRRKQAFAHPSTGPEADRIVDAIVT
jgi:hypothetical protein